MEIHNVCTTKTLSSNSKLIRQQKKKKTKLPIPFIFFVSIGKDGSQGAQGIQGVAVSAYITAFIFYFLNKSFTGLTW